jgi:hypothetical protein
MVIMAFDTRGKLKHHYGNENGVSSDEQRLPLPLSVREGSTIFREVLRQMTPPPPPPLHPASHEPLVKQQQQQHQLRNSHSLPANDRPASKVVRKELPHRATVSMATAITNKINAVDQIYTTPTMTLSRSNLPTKSASVAYDVSALYCRSRSAVAAASGGGRNVGTLNYYGLDLDEESVAIHRVAICNTPASLLVAKTMCNSSKSTF